jgi:hypothetical protein
MPADELRKNHNLSKEKFEELMLQLEFHLALCISYRKQSGKWQAIVTPFHEWREFLLFQQETKPQTITDTKNISQKYPEEFTLLSEIASFLVSQLGNGTKKKNEKAPSPLALKYSEMMDFVEFTNGKPKLKSSPEHYLKMSLQDQSMYLYRHAFSEIIRENELEIENPERSFREVEKSLRRVLHCGWIYFEDFMKGFISQVGKAEPVMLKKTGRKWRYALAQYSVEEKNFIETVIFGPLSDAGLVLAGTHNNKPCFTLTSFGKIAFGE